MMSPEQQGKKQKQTKTQETAPRFNDVKFVNWTLTKEQAAECKGWLLVLGDFDSALEKFEEEGYKLTSRWDSYGECWGAFAYPEEGKTENGGYILTGRGSSPLRAVKQLLYIHYAVMDRGWAAWSVATRGIELDD
jgi:hypothetical protein